MFLLIVYFSQFLLTLFAQTQQDLKNADVFLNWLDQNQKFFSTCKPKILGNEITLCDQTKIDKKELSDFLKKSSFDAILWLRNKNIKIDVLCDEDLKPESSLVSECKSTVSNKNFEKVTSLHGQYLPGENTVLIRNSASLGSLMHEYIHHLQYENKTPVFGKVYKKERTKIQKALIKIMDDQIEKVQKLEKKKNKKELKKELRLFMSASEKMMKFSIWQDLIDEQNIFLLYLSFGKKIGLPEKDIEFAKINMTKICDRLKKNSEINYSCPI